MMAFLSTALERPWALPLVLLVPALVAWIVVAGRRRRRARLSRLGSDAIVARLVPPDVVRRAGPRAARLGLAALFAAAAFVGPRWGRETTMVETEGVDMVLALDASSSMLATDEEPSRLARMKQEVRRLRALGGGDRVALVAFAGRSYILTPLTVDAGALDLFLDNLDPTVVGQAGSSIASTLRQGRELLAATRSASDKALVVMSDGETHEPIEEVLEEARRLKEANVALVTVGFGTERGSTIPVRDGNRTVEKRDENGEVVVTRYSPTTLRAAAEAAGGTFIAAEATDKAARIRQALRGLRTQRRQSEAGNTRTPRFQLFLLPAVLLLLLDTMLMERGARRRRSAAAAMPAEPGAVPPPPAEPEAPARSLRGRAARASSLVVLALAASGTPRAAQADDAADAAREMRAGRTHRAIALYRQAIANGDQRPSTLYNLGTALLAADSLVAASDALERATKSSDAEIRYRAHYNLGLAQLRRGLAPGDSADQHLGAAVETYKKALLMRPADRDAKWNYELALKKRQGGGGGGGGQQQDPAQSDPGEGAQAPTPRPAGGIGREQAEQILNSAARDEREVQGKRQRRNRPQPPPGGKDW